MTGESKNEDTVDGMPVSHRTRSWGRERWSLVVLVLIAFALGIYALGGREFWLDEAISSYISGLGWAGTIEYVRNAPWEHPPLYFLALGLWQRLVGTTEFALRFFSLLWGVLFVPLLYLFARRVASRRLGTLAALLATVSPFMIAYSQDARMYTMLPCLALLALLIFWSGLKRKDQPGLWLAYLVVVIIGVFTHYLFAFLPIATALYLALEYVQYRRARRWGIAAHLLPLPVIGLWLILSPGVRDSLQGVAQGATAFSLAYKLNKIMPTLLLAEIRPQPPLSGYILMAAGWLLILLGVWCSQKERLLGRRSWLLLVLTLIAPMVCALVVPYGVLGRHLGFILIPGFIFMGLGLAALQRRGALSLGAGILGILLLSSFGLVTHFTSSSGDFGQALAYIDQRGHPGDGVILSQPPQRYLAEYYNEENWPVYYVPDIPNPPTAEAVDETLQALSQGHNRLWLGPAGPWTADPEYLAEQWLAANAFQAEKVWFPDDSSVSLYLTSREGLTSVDVGKLNWEGRIHLAGFATSHLRVPVADALRVRFSWLAGDIIDGRYEVSLQLVDERGYVWAERRGEPCGGWCPTDSWWVGEHLWDQHALVVPPGTPPGVYHLEVAWLPLGGGLPLQADQSGNLMDRVELTEVTVLPGGLTEELWDLPNSLQVTFGGEVTLLGYEPAEAEVRLGGELLVRTYWRDEVLPSTYYALALELVDDDGLVVANSMSLLTPSFPTSLWQPGHHLREQSRLDVPVTVTPGRYTLRIALISPEGERLAVSGQAPRPARLREGELYTAKVQVTDRLRQFDLPSVDNPMDATAGRQAHLLGYDLALDDAQPGGRIPLTLYWQAGGPMVLPFKVFTHLVDDENNIWAQHDAPPGGGCCPTNTWVEGEVVVDEHLITLGVDLPPGTYKLVVGLYDEETRSRVPAYDGDGTKLALDRIEIIDVTIESLPAQREEVILPTLEDVRSTTFLPLVSKGVSSR